MSLPRAARLLTAAVFALALPPGLTRPAGQPTPWDAHDATGASRDRARPLARLGRDLWHAAGHRGRGVKVAVIDSGFRGYRSFLGTALPDHLLARSCRFDGALEARDSQHGILCGEVIHALAPEAELLFTSWEPDRPD